MVLASRPVCSVMRLAARPVGAASATLTPLATRMRRIASRQRGLAHAGTTRDHRHLGAETPASGPRAARPTRSCRSRLSTHGSALLDIDVRPGRWPGGSLDQPGSDGLLGQMQTLEEETRLIADGVGDDLSLGKLLDMAERIRARIDFQQLLGQRVSASTGKAQCPSSVAVWSANEMPARIRCGAVFSIPSLAAMASAVRKPIPRTSLASRYGSSVMT